MRRLLRCPEPRTTAPVIPCQVSERGRIILTSFRLVRICSLQGQASILTCSSSSTSGLPALVVSIYASLAGSCGVTIILLLRWWLDWTLFLAIGDPRIIQNISHLSVDFAHSPRSSVPSNQVIGTLGILDWLLIDVSSLIDWLALIDCCLPINWPK
jgi:hypothetical protein